MVTVLLFLLILSLLVFAHEFGHFFVAKKSGVAVEEFGFGFPPRAWSFTYKGTVYSLNWIPMGGFVRLKGENGADRHAADSFGAQKPWKRFLVLFAGVAMNYLAAAVILSISFAVGSPTVLSDGIPEGASVRQVEIRVATVIEGSPAARAGIVPGDVLLSLDGTPVTTEAAARDYIRSRANGVDALVRSASGADHTYHLVAEDLKAANNVHAVGIGMMATGLVSLPVWRAVPHGFAAAAGMVRDVAVGLWDLLKSLVVQHKVSADLTGPVGIAVMTGDVAKLGLLYLLPFVAILSANLAVVNLLPFPALDGGRILFLLIEKIRRKPTDERVEALAHNIGFLVLIILIFLVTARDLLQVGGRILSAIHV